jgi:hypothetical protein
MCGFFMRFDHDGFQPLASHLYEFLPVAGDG